MEMQHLTTATNDPLPLFCRIADVDPYLRRSAEKRQYQDSASVRVPGRLPSEHTIYRFIKTRRLHPHP
jgi:hypothetical protein